MAIPAKESPTSERKFCLLRLPSGTVVKAIRLKYADRPGGEIAVLIDAGSRELHKGWLSATTKDGIYTIHPGSKVRDDPNIDQATLELKYPYEIS